MPFVCQRDMCPNAGTAEAAKVCFDHCISITFASDSPPPLYLCIECANEIHRENPDQMFYDILRPMQQASVSCENKVGFIKDFVIFSLVRRKLCVKNLFSVFWGNIHFEVVFTMMTINDLSSV